MLTRIIKLFVSYPNKPTSLLKKPLIGSFNFKQSGPNNLVRFNKLIKKEFSTDITLFDEIKKEAKRNHFQDLGLDSRLCVKLNTNFNITTPTNTQEALIPSILDSREVLLRDTTGCGKTFGTTLALLDQAIKDTSLLNGPISMILVPNRELAIQIQNWGEKLTPDGMDSRFFIQSIYRGQNEDASLDQFLKFMPKLVVGTPNKILEWMDNGTLKMDQLNRIVLDEVDHLLRLPTRHAPLKKVWNRDVHPKPTQLILNKLDFENGDIKLMAMSATINRGLRFYFKQQNWMSLPLYIDGADSKPQLPPSSLEHMCIVVKGDRVSNLNMDQDSNKMAEPQFESQKEDYFTPKKVNNIKAEFKKKSLNDILKLKEKEQKEKDLDENKLLECVAVACHADQIQSGLLFVSNDRNVQRVIDHLKTLNINSDTIESYYQPKSNQTSTPTLLIGTTFSARGLDLPSPTHVFILGYPDTIPNYLHLAGRAGRLGKGLSQPQWGRVITVITDKRYQEHRMVTLFNFLNIQPLEFPHID